MSNKENYSIKIYLHDLIKRNSRSKSLIFISLSWLIICSSIGMIFDTHLLKVSNQQSILHYFNGLRIILSILIIIIFKVTTMKNPEIYLPVLFIFLWQGIIIIIKLKIEIII